MLFAILPGFFTANYAKAKITPRPMLQQVPLSQLLRDFRNPGAILFSLLLFFQFGNEWSIAGWLPLFLIRRLGISPADSLLMLALYWTALLVGRKPNIPAHSVCFECKQRGNVCVVVAHGTPCLGPVTHAGCGALCPAHHRGCYGCFGPMETPNAGAQVGLLRATGMDEADVLRAFRTFNSGAPAFIELSQVARPHERRSE